MAQSHTQAQLAARAMSPAQGSPSPVPTGSYLSAVKRPQVPSGPPSQPGSPFSTAAFAASPGAPTPPPTSTSPAPPPTGHPSPYANGIATPTPVLSLPQAHFAGTPSPAMSPQLPTTPGAPPTSTPMAMPMSMSMPMPMPMPTIATPMPMPTPSPMPLPTPASQYTNATMAPIVPAHGAGSPAPSGPSSGSMGPPLKPPEKPTKELEYDVTDSLAGTGIDIRAEEQFLANMFHYDEGRTGFPQLGAGGKSSLYGAGPANQPAQPTDGASQDEMMALAGRRAWDEAAARLAQSRAQELHSPFLNIAVLHARAERIAKANGLALNVDAKASADGKNPLGKMRNPADAPQPTVMVTTKLGPDSAIISTFGSWLPGDVNLADQVALLSLATNQRLRNLVGDANVLSRNRQTTSHGEIPEEWLIAAAPPKQVPDVSADGSGAAGASSPRAKSLKRPHDPSTSTAVEPPQKQAKVKGSSNTATTLRDVAKGDRDWEEARARKRNVRKDGSGEASAAHSRAGSVAPGTPGTVAPEDKPEKPPSKKELKRSQSMKTAEAASHANQNLTSSLFSSFGRAGSLFGKKGKNKTYDWMNAAKPGSGSLTPNRASSGSVGGSALANALGAGGPGPGKNTLTSEGRVRMGAWREDGSKGEGIQLRDWVVVLEADGNESKALQVAYDKLDESMPK